MHSSAPRLSCSKPTSPLTAWTSAGVRAMWKRSIFIRGTNFISCTLMKNALQCPQTLLFQANLSLNCLDVCVGPCYVQWIHIQHRNKLYLWYINEKCTPAPPDSPVASQPLPELLGRLQGSGLCVNNLYLSQEQTLLVVHQ